MCRNASKKPWILWSLSFCLVITVYYCVTNVQNVWDYTSLVFELFLMHFSPRLYVFVVCSICKRKKNALVEHLIHSPVFGLGHNGIILYMLLFVCVAFFVNNIEVKPMFGECINFSYYPMQSVGLIHAQWIRHLTVLPQTWPNPKYSAVDMTWDNAHFIYLEFNYRVSFTLYTFGRQCKSSFSTSRAIPSYFIMPFFFMSCPEWGIS